MKTSGQHGYTLVELMTSLVMGMILLAAAFALYVMSRGNQTTIANSSALDERGWMAIDAVSSQLRQAGYAPLEGGFDAATPTLSGIDACGAPSAANGVLRCAGASAGSDAVLIRFFGASRAGQTTPDDTILDCAGNGVAASDAERPAGASLLFVRDGADGIPALMCRSGTGAGSDDIALVRGVERMELLYGVSTDNDDIPDKFVAAKSITNSEWSRVAAVKVSLLLRGDYRRREEKASAPISMFGAFHDDPVYQVDTSKDPKIIRRLFTSTVQIRNSARPLAGGR